MNNPLMSSFKYDNHSGASPLTTAIQSVGYHVILSSMHCIWIWFVIWLSYISPHSTLSLPFPEMFELPTRLTLSSDMPVKCSSKRVERIKSRKSKSRRYIMTSFTRPFFVQKPILGICQTSACETQVTSFPKPLPVETTGKHTILLLFA